MGFNDRFLFIIFLTQNHLVHEIMIRDYLFRIEFIHTPVD